MTRPVSTSSRRLLFLALAIYLLLGVAYALNTPIWQAPDEPAHFNNVVAIATTGRLPQLQAGDYDQAYLEKLKAEKFPPSLSVTSVRYEGHQPPLYYLLMAPAVAALSASPIAIQVRVLRLINVLLGALVIFFIWLSVRRLLPKHPDIAVLAAAFVAWLPMHIAMSAAINNDTLAELWIVVVMYRLLGHAMSVDASFSSWSLTGILIGLGLLTKFQTYYLAPLAVGVWAWQVWHGWRQHVRIAQVWKSGLALLLAMVLVPLAWWLRNMRLYGVYDPLGLQRHNMVVVGQPRTNDWIATYGWEAFLDRFATFTFRSFWGVFGWMGVFMDDRVYLFLTIFTILAAVGLGYQLWRWRSHEFVLTPAQMRGCGLLLAQLVAVVAAYLWYNIDFVQHQGRYLFPALLPIGLAVAIGLLGLFSVRGSRWGAMATLMLFGWWLGRGWLHGEMNKWALLMSGGMAAGLWARRRITSINAFWLAFTFEGLLVLIALYALFGAIMPQLR